MPGTPARKSLLSKMVQGSKSFTPRRPLVRTTGSSVMLSPPGSSMGVLFLMLGSIEPTRTLSPAMWKMRRSWARLLR